MALDVSLTDKNNLYPIGNSSQGIGSCISFELLPSDIFDLNPLDVANVTITVDNGAETGYFLFEDRTFTIDNGSDYTNDTFKCDATSALNTANNIRNMLLCNVFILKNWSVKLNIVSGTNVQVICSPKIWNYNPTGNTSDNFDLGKISLSVTDFSDSVIIPGLKIVWQLFENGLQKQGEAMEMNGIVPIVNQMNGAVIPVKINFSDIVTRSLKTTFPTYKYNEVQYDYTILNRYFLRYGWLNITGCDQSEVFTKQTNDIIIVNNSLDKNSVLGFLDYCYDINTPTRRAKFMNFAHECNSMIKATTNQWLWFYDMLPAQKVGITIRQFVLYTFLGADLTTISSTEIDYNTAGILPLSEDGIGVIIIPAGFGNCPVTVPGNAKYLRISVRYEEGATKTTISESATFILTDNCSNYEFYFLSSKGGYDTILFEKIEEVTFDINQTTINLNKYCREYNLVNETGTEPSEAGVLDYLTFLNTTGRKQVNTSEKKEFKVTSKRIRPQTAEANYFEEFLKSESRKIRLDKKGYAVEGSFVYTENIILTHSSVITFGDEGMVQYTFRFQFANQNSPISEY